MRAYDRLFQGLLRLYPAAFRARYGDELQQVCADEMRDARAVGARRGPLQTLLGTIVDVAWCGLVERASHSGSPAPTPTMRLLGVLGIAGGLILVSAFLFFIPGTFDTARLVLFNAGAIAVAIGVFSLLPGVRRRRAALLVALVIVANLAYGLGVVYTAQFERPFAGGRGVVFAWLNHALWLADSLFAIVVFRLGGVVARLAALALALGGFAIVGIAPGLRSLWEPNELASAIALAGVALNGLGWILLGLVVAFPGQVEGARSEVREPV